jgi:hypothetical protein
MTRQRYLISGGVLAAITCVACLVSWLVVPTTRVIRANYERIERGMAKAEVEAIFGGPADFVEGGPEEPIWWREAWVDAETHTTIQVYFFAPDGKVANSNWFEGTETSFIDKLRRWFHWEERVSLAK